jgi:hypothetical protein
MRTFSAQETRWQLELDGIELAGFRRRAFAFLIDWTIVSIILSTALSLGAIAYVGIAHRLGHPVSEVNLGSETSRITISPDEAAPRPCRKASTSTSACLPKTRKPTRVLAPTSSTKL